MNLNQEKTRILVYGMYGAINVGDEIIALTMAENLKVTFPHGEVCIASMNPKATSKFLGNENLLIEKLNFFDRTFWTSLFEINRMINKYDVIVVGGGGLFQDQYSFNLPAGSLLMCAIGVAKGKPTFVMGTGAGPLKRKWLQKSLVKVFQLIDGVYLRDNESSDTVNRLSNGIVKPVITADVVPALMSFDENRKLWNPDSNVISFILRRWPGLDIVSVARLVEELVNKGYKILFHCYEEESDTKLVQEILDECDKKTLDSVTYSSPTTARETINNLTKSKIVISMRLHGCVLAASQGIPWLPIFYERKIKGFAEQMNMDSRMQHVYDVKPEMLTKIDECYTFYKENREELLDNFNNIRVNSLENFKLLKKSLNSEMKKGTIIRKQGKKEVIKLFLFGTLSKIFNLTKRIITSF
ncbi:polysaccharide pyruvyl transferase family protein [Neobacillus drentensis]|uniref:polysaccharide pyruvyl transferase family protein n=1 Tax=Neobacillus drentensis TaxID=220684 RepID=UPI003001A8D5